MRHYEPVIREFVRRRHGIYVLYRKNRVQHIGIAQNLRNRIKHHLREGVVGTPDQCPPLGRMSSGRISVLDESPHLWWGIRLQCPLPGRPVPGPGSLEHGARSG